MFTTRSPVKPAESNVDGGSDSASANNTSNTKCKQCHVVVNELLSFVCNKIDTLPEPAILQLCLKTYTSDEIDSARSIVYNLLAPTKRAPRRKEGCEQKCLQEIIKIIKEYEPDKLPTFVAKNLNKLPPVTFDYIDVTTFLKELLVIIKNDIAGLKTSKPTSDDISEPLSSLKNEVDVVKKMLKDVLSKGRSPPPVSYHQDKNNGRRVVHAKGISPAVSAPSVNNNSTDVRAESERRTADAGAAGVATNGDAVNSESMTSGSVINQSLTLTQTPFRPSYRDIVSTNTRTQIGDDGFTLVTRKKASTYKNTRGTLQNTNRIQAVEQTADIYVSRTKKHITEDDIKGHITDMGEEIQSVELLKQWKETNFNSFKITVPNAKVSIFLKKDFWPEGLVFRRFKSQKPATITANTSNT